MTRTFNVLNAYELETGKFYFVIVNGLPDEATIKFLGRTRKSGKDFLNFEKPNGGLFEIPADKFVGADEARGQHLIKQPYIPPKWKRALSI